MPTAPDLRIGERRSIERMTPATTSSSARDQGRMSVAKLEVDK
jgi:hypothetical protein